MVDTLVDSNVTNSLDIRGMSGPYWTDENTAAMIFLNQFDQLVYARTTDGGVNWTSTVADTSTQEIIAFFDKEVPGDTGNVLHILYLETEGTNSISYRSLDIATNTLGAQRFIESGITPNSTLGRNRLAITKTQNGNLMVAFETFLETRCYRSTDSGVNWTSRTNLFEAADIDWALMFPANTTDGGDAAAIYWDASSDEISIKMYDDSANTWTETSISTGMNSDTGYLGMDASVRHSDNHILLAAHSNDDHPTDDLRTWDLTVDSIASPTVTAKTNIFTNQDNSVQAAVVINQQNDDVYVAYIKGGTWFLSTDVVFHKSEDGMTTWGTEQAYSQTTDDIRLVHGGRTVTSAGGRVQWSFYNDDLADIFVNLVNDIAIPAAAVGTNMQINIGDTWRSVSGAQINIGDTWRTVVGAQINIGDTWRTIF